MNDKTEVEILLVEDNPTDAELCIRALKQHRLADKLAWVKDGAEALDFLFRHGAYADSSARGMPKVILLDLRLPKVDGLDVLRTVKADERTRSIPVVVLASSKDDRDMAATYQLGVNSYVSKPVAFEEFEKVVSDIGRYWLLLNRLPEP